MNDHKRLYLRDKTSEMFYHAFDSYMTYAYPLDELNPVNCSGRGPDRNDPNNWNINDVLGGFSLTLIDSLDMFPIIGDVKGFHEAITLTEKISFDLDSRVQVFEVTIRVLGSLLSAHILASDESYGFAMPGYKGHLLTLARELADRLLPAFWASPTGIPYPRINLRYGVLPWETNDTCTAGAGTLLLEFGMLSRLTGDEQYERAARKALLALWDRRSYLNLVGNTLSIYDGTWHHSMSGIGAGIDSFFEYLFKAYILFGDDQMFDIFDVSYKAILLHLRDTHGYIYKNVNMHTGDLATTWVDSLAAFFPGLQVLIGDIDNAVRHHWLYYTIWKKYRAIPERFDFNAKTPSIKHYPLRPEFIESTYMLYQATKNPIYLEIGEQVLYDLEKYSRTRCGFAGLDSVEKKTIVDRMESFFLSETLKYLYLLFDTDNFINKPDSNWIFTTEGHIFPVTRQSSLKYAKKPTNSPKFCPVFPRANPPTSGRQLDFPLPIEHVQAVSYIVGNVPDRATEERFAYYGLSSNTSTTVEELHQCQHESNEEIFEIKLENSHASLDLLPIKDGYYALSVGGATMKLKNNPLNNNEYILQEIDGFRIGEGKRLKMNEAAVRFLRPPNQPISKSHSVLFQTLGETLEFRSVPAIFGPKIPPSTPFSSELYIPYTSHTNPKTFHSISTLCTYPSTPQNDEDPSNKIFLVRRGGGCSFIEKTLIAEKLGAIGLLVASDSESLFTMSPGHEEFIQDGDDPTGIPAWLITKSAAEKIIKQPFYIFKLVMSISLRTDGAGGDDETKRMGHVTMKSEESDMWLQYNGKPVSNVLIVEQSDIGEVTWWRKEFRGKRRLDFGQTLWCLRFCLGERGGEVKSDGVVTELGVVVSGNGISVEASGVFGLGICCRGAF
ncbi:alpha mannosidase-like protein [Nowakowskiella sp. JEL0407]|nr:alpha mannosidase-like protein [Nowakowskiella sp. JEL0407]